MPPLNILGANHGTMITGENAGDLFSFGIELVGDVDGDGFDDVLVSAKGAAPQANGSAGEVYLLYGDALVDKSNIDIADLIATGDAIVFEGLNTQNYAGRHQHLGNPISRAGDVDGDGLADILIGAPDADPHQDAVPGGRGPAGEVYLVFGQTLKDRSSINLADIPVDGGGYFLRAQLARH